MLSANPPEAEIKLFRVFPWLSNSSLGEHG